MPADFDAIAMARPLQRRAVMNELRRLERAVSKSVSDVLAALDSDDNVRLQKATVSIEHTLGMITKFHSEPADDAALDQLFQLFLRLRSVLGALRVTLPQGQHA
jgi:hypothetical protein